MLQSYHLVNQSFLHKFIILQAQINDLRSHMTSVESEKLEMQEKIKVFDCDITSKKVWFLILIITLFCAMWLWIC